jgi:hypothetical protein
MNPRVPGLVALVVGFVLIAHAVLAFTKHRWVTGLVELIAAGVLLWHWWLRGSTVSLPGPAQSRGASE